VAFPHHCVISEPHGFTRAVCSICEANTRNATGTVANIA